MRSKIVFISVLLLSFINSANAQETPAIENIIVSASKDEQRLEDVISPAIIINEREIVESGFRSLSDLLHSLGGINVSQNGGVGQLTSIFMQGSNSNHVLVLVDGVAINDLATGISAIQNIPISLIEKIEIVKSPRATLYGSNAVGGVVSVFTKKKSEREDYSVMLGSDETKEISLSKVVHNDSNHYGFSATFFDTDGFPTKVGSDLDDPHENRSVNAFIKRDFEKLSIEAGFWNSQGETSYKDFFLSSISQDFHNSTMNFTLDHAVSEKWSYSLQAKYNKDFLDQNDSNDFNHSERSGLEWVNRFQVNESNKTLVGVILDDEKFTASNYGVGVNVDFENKAMFIEHLYSKSKHQALIAFRKSNSDFTNDKDAWNLEYGYKINPKLRIMILGGSAYRNPSAFDLYGFGGNTSLAPEKSKKFGLGFSASLSASTELDVRYFDNQINDLIAFSYVDYRLYNIEEAETKGVDINMTTQFNEWDLKLNATIQDPQNLTSNSQLLRRPKNSYGMTMRRNIGAVTVNLNIRRDSTRYDFGGLKLEAYTLMNASLRWQINQQLMINASFKNALDEDYVLANGYNTPKRKVFLGFNYMMN
ncbi:TonB-dependent receptor [Gammaproteobacteria bacterium]|nr:TonB-dependent receptor [Gammaproteobacteria bacterium]